MIKEIEKFNLENNREMDIHSRFLDIQSELGELGKEILKSTKYGKQNFKLTTEFIEEFGDSCYSLISFGLEAGVDIEKAVLGVIEKYKKRLNEHGNMGSNKNN